MSKRILLSILLVTTAFGARRAASPGFDTSGNSTLNGKYFFRLLSMSVQPNGTTLSAQSASGSITFDGNGNYTLSGQKLDSQTGQTSPFSVTGVYGVASNGVAFFANPLAPEDTAESINGAIGANNIITGSSTETAGDFNLFIAMPAGAQAPTNATFQGTYWIGVLEFPQAKLANARNSLFKLTPNGQGGLGTVTVTGRDGAQQNKAITEESQGATYSFAADGTGTLNIPAPAGSGSPLFSGNITFFVSADGNYILGGHANGFDIFYGFRALSGSGGDSVYQGVYFTAGMDADLFDPQALWMETLNGSVNALGNGTSLWHAREAPIDVTVFDDTYDSYTSLDQNGVDEKDFYTYVFGVNGDAFMVVGNQSEYALIAGVRAQAPTPGSGPFINPHGIFNSANYAPITNSVAPGELVTIFGQNLAAAETTASSSPFPTTLGGVQVMINGQAAPVYYVSPEQISAIVPYGTVNDDFIQFQVVNNGATSNAVTLYQWSCAPGVFAQNQRGTGFGAIQHSDYTLVTEDHPAKPGETILVYLTGLGAVTPAVADGAPGPRDPLSTTDETYKAYFSGNNANNSFVSEEGSVGFAGLAPDYAGLYQMNVTIPANAPLGNDVYLGISGPACYNEQARVPIAQ
jgi:uncharacterized protein (TIGR03437 family)